ncbi:major histocompatibility complex class I-related gene protein-like [Hemicordylus capensis]|uniref:major histocompatibility complex class I-related gene protein-like n=1 Tax=Hemicordylus capensis TaxID=884348 RepID=UPI002303130B|nr:major histocompatibility complex class I-related gene protein-like [Hemicordylus capensis]
MEKLGRNVGPFWTAKSKGMQNWEAPFRAALVDRQNYYNQSEGLHTWQYLYGCRLSKDGQKGGYMQYGYDGRDFLSFDKETLIWAATNAADTGAQMAKKEWDCDTETNKKKKHYLEETCIHFLQTFVTYGNESLLRKEAPLVKVAHKVVHEGLTTLICQIYGFYPKAINATWMKDGAVWEQETFLGDVIPNSDGTYHAWLSIQINSKDRGHYQCHVEHASQPQPLEFSVWEMSG